MKIRINPLNGGFSKRPPLYISILKLAGLSGSGVKIMLNLRGCILTTGYKIVIFSGVCITFFFAFFFDSFKPGVKIRKNLLDGKFPKDPNCRFQF